MSLETPLYDQLVTDRGFDPLANLAPDDAAPGPLSGASPEFPTDDLDAGSGTAADGAPDPADPPADNK